MTHHDHDDPYVWLYEVLRSSSYEFTDRIEITTSKSHIVQVVMDPVNKSYMYIDRSFVAVIEDKKHICFIVTSFMIVNKLDIIEVSLIPSTPTLPCYIYKKDTPMYRRVIELQDELTDKYAERTEYISLRTLV